MSVGLHALEAGQFWPAGHAGAAPQLEVPTTTQLKYAGQSVSVAHGAAQARAGSPSKAQATETGASHDAGDRTEMGLQVDIETSLGRDVSVFNASKPRAN